MDAWKEGDIVENDQGHQLTLKGGQWVPVTPGVGTDLVKSIPQYATTAAGSLITNPLNPDFVPSLMQGVAKLGTWGVKKGAELLGYPETAKAAGELMKEFSEPTPSDKVQASAEKIAGGPLYQPQTGVGQAINTGAAVIPGAMTLGATAPAAMRQAGAMEVARNVAPEGWEPAADLVAGAVGQKNPLAVKPANAYRYEQGQRLAQELPNANLSLGRITGNEKQMRRESRALGGTQPENEVQAINQRLMDSTGYTQPVQAITKDVIEGAFNDTEARRAALGGSHVNVGKPDIISAYKHVMSQPDAIIDPAAKATFDAFGGQVTGLGHGISGDQYVTLRSDLTKKAFESQGALKRGYEGLVSALDDAAHRSVGDAFDVNRAQRQNLAMMKGAVTPQGNVDLKALSDEIAKRGSGMLDPQLRQFVTDAQAAGLGSPYPQPGGIGKYVWPAALGGAALWGANQFTGGAIPAAMAGLTGGVGGSVLHHMMGNHLPAVNLPNPVGWAKSKLEASAPMQYMRQPSDHDWVRSLMQASPYILNQ